MENHRLNYQKILDLIEKKNLSLTEAAKGCHLTSQTFYNIQKGSDIGAQKLVRIADFLNVSMDFLFDRDESSIQIGHQVNGDGNNISGDITISECIKEIEFLKNEIDHYKELLNEKERTINILLSSKEYFNNHVQR